VSSGWVSPCHCGLRGGNALPHSCRGAASRNTKPLTPHSRPNPNPALAMWRVQETVTQRVRFHNASSEGDERDAGVQYWPTPSAGPHVLSVVLDYGGTDVAAGNITVRYCGWPGLPCDCGVGACHLPVRLHRATTNTRRDEAHTGLTHLARRALQRLPRLLQPALASALPTSAVTPLRKRVEGAHD
jgi:hypothetical protein